MKARSIRTAAVVASVALAGPLGVATGAGPVWASPGVPGPATVSAKERAAVLAWLTAHPKVFNRLQASSGLAAHAASDDKVAALHLDCLNLKKVVAGAQAIAPIPDASIETVFKSALADVMGGTLDCINATSATGSLNHTLLEQASKYWETGGDQLLKVAEDLDSLAG